MALKLITPPAVEPLELSDVEAQCRADLADEALLVQGYIAAVRQKAELCLRRALVTQTWEMTLDAFPAVINLPLPPLQSVESIKYIDTDGLEQILSSSSYKVDASSEPARIVPAYGCTWPATRNEISAVRIRFTCGYGDAADVPVCVKQWMLLNVATLVENRETHAVISRGSVADLSTIADGLLDAVPGGRVLTF